MASINEKSKGLEFTCDKCHRAVFVTWAEYEEMNTNRCSTPISLNEDGFTFCSGSLYFWGSKND